MAQRFPDLFDGIVAGAPVFDFTGVHFNHRQVYGAFHPDWPVQEETDILAEAILDKCDALDGLSDGAVQHPRMCEFDPVADLPDCDAGKERGAVHGAGAAGGVRKHLRARRHCNRRGPRAGTPGQRRDQGFHAGGRGPPGMRSGTRGRARWRPAGPVGNLLSSAGLSMP